MRKNKIFTIMLILMIWPIVEGISYIGLVIVEGLYHLRYSPRIDALSVDQKNSLQEFISRAETNLSDQDPYLGWSNNRLANSAGMRDDQEYDSLPDPGITRIVAFGDSFTFGSDVSLGETWAKQLSVLDNSVEVLNYGVGAYGLDQAYLRYLKEGTRYNPHIVFIGYMSENINRNVNVFRPFYTHGYKGFIFTKPRFKVNGEELLLIKNPVSTIEDHKNFISNDRIFLKEIGKNDYHYSIGYDRSFIDFLPSIRFYTFFIYTIRKRVINPIFELGGMYSTDSEAYEVTLKIFDTFYQKALDDGVLPVIIIFPDLNDQWRSRGNSEKRYAPLLDYLRSKKYLHIDVMEALKPYEDRYTIGDLSVQWGHYSPLGNKIVTEHIMKQIKAMGLTDAEMREETLISEQKRVLK